MDPHSERAKTGDADVKKGGKNAFFDAFEALKTPVFRFAFRLTGSHAEAEDIAQECFLSLLRNQDRFDANRASLRAYLFGAVRNQALKRLRVREQAGGEAPEPVEFRSPETVALRGEVCEAVARAVAILPFNQREVILLAHYEQMPLAEIADLLGLETGAVKSRLQRARASLKELLAPYATSQHSAPQGAAESVAEREL